MLRSVRLTYDARTPGAASAAKRSGVLGSAVVLAASAAMGPINTFTGEDRMKLGSFGIVLATLFAGVTAQAQTPSWTTPADSSRCPSKWGAEDERGAGNHMKPQTVLKATKLIQTGEVIELGHVLNPQMPLSTGRTFK